MAGHSQFKNIMHRKGRQDAVRSKIFSKLAREITVAAKLGAPDPAMNPRLRLAIQNAKAESMPKDNIQRAINKAAGGALGETGSVSFMWDRAGEIYYPASAGSADKVMEAAIEAGADDVESDEEGHTIYSAFETIGEVVKALEDQLGEAESVKMIWKPQNAVPVDEDRAQSLMKLVAVLEDDDDVQSVYANFEVDDATLAKLSAA